MEPLGMEKQHPLDAEATPLLAEEVAAQDGSNENQPTPSPTDLEAIAFLLEKSEEADVLPQSLGKRVLASARRLQKYILVATLSSLAILLTLVAIYRIHIAVDDSSCNDIQKVWWESFGQSLECTNATGPTDHRGTIDGDDAHGKRLQIYITTKPGLLSHPIEAGRIVVLFGATEDDLDDTDVRTTANKFFAMDVSHFHGQDVASSDLHADGPETGVFGWPIPTLDELPAGTYWVKGFLNVYNETVTRSDGSTVTVRFPCGDGNLPLGGTGGLSTKVSEIQVHGGAQTIALQLQAFSPPIESDGGEIGGCSQGNYKDTDLLRYVKIRSESLSRFWNRDMYVGAKVFLPFGYNSTDTNTRYPVLYSQFHWLGGDGWWSHDANFTDAWYRGMIPERGDEPERPTPKLIVVMFRHENPFYDDSYAVNTPNLGPYGDALNDELLPHLDMMFNTIPEPYARIQEGGSTGGWAAAANVVFRPDLYGACFASYPDSLDFHRHQDNNLYEQTNAHFRDGLLVPSNRKIGDDGVPYVRVTMAEENHWELAFATSGRSALQTDIWFAVFGVQGINGYPLAAWDKVTGEIYPEVIELWKPMDLTHHIISNWDSELKLGQVLRGRMFIYVGGVDSYYLNEGVEQFRTRITEKGGPDWANITVLQGEPHGGVYNLLPMWTYIDLLLGWIADHAPDGKTPLQATHITAESRGNLWQDVLAAGGRQAALARQAPPHIVLSPPDGTDESARSRPMASVGRWDPGVALEAQWFVDGKGINGTKFVVQQEQMAMYPWNGTGKTLQLVVTGTKRDYVSETRSSNVVMVE